MEQSKKYKTQLWVVVALLCLFVFVAFRLLQPELVGAGDGTFDALLSTLVQKTPQDPSLAQLDRILKSASTDNATVILTTLNEAWAKPGSIFDLFLESFRIGEQTQPLLDHLVVIAVDQKAMERCESLNLHCHLLTVGGIDSPGSEKRFMSKEYLKLMWERTHFLGKVLKLGYNFLHTDVDIIWFRTPFPHFSAADDFTIACDRFTGDPHDLNNLVNGGFMHVKSNNVTIDFYDHWYEARNRFPGKHEQHVFNMIKKSKYVRDLGLKMRFLDTDVFGGFCRHGDDLNRLCTLHANCCVGLQNKIDDLRTVLDVWRNFTGLPEDQRANGIHWKAPIKCKI